MKTPLAEPRSTERIRLTISVTPEVHETFVKLSKATNQSLSSAMGEWLADTIDAANFMAEKVSEARAAPRLVAREMHAYALGLADETGEVLRRVRGVEAGGKRSATASPPPSNTGGKVPGQEAKQKRRNA